MCSFVGGDLWPTFRTLACGGNEYRCGAPAQLALRTSPPLSNENPHGCSPKVKAALAQLDPIRYSDPAGAALRKALGSKLDVASERIVIVNGSEEMIAMICRAVLRPFSAVVTVMPGFGLHEIEPRPMAKRSSR